VHSLQKTLDNFSKIEQISNSFKGNLEEIKDELDQQLDSINLNSAEIQSNFDYIEGINKRVDKLEEKIDELTFLIKENLNYPKVEVKHESLDLTSEEKDVFFSLYVTTEPLTYEELSTRTNKPTYLIEDLITSMKIKNIPIIKKTFAGKVLVILKEDFRELQAKHNIVKLNNNFLTNFI